MIIVTGGAGFIGSNLVHALNRRGNTDILVVDNLSQGVKFVNLADCRIADYLDKEDFIRQLREGYDFGRIEAVFHQGACSSTTEWDGRYVMRNNYQYSKELLQFCLRHGIAYVYASSASVYGDGRAGFRECLDCERPLTMYGYSKFQFDQYVRRMLPTATGQIVGLRYFNVYGPREQHKGDMASVALHHHRQLTEGDTVRLFEGAQGYADGEQCRDFVYVADVADVNLWFLDHPQCSGIFNLGTGRAQPFNDIANAMIAGHGHGRVDYIPFPAHLQGRYQNYTQADIGALRAAGYDRPLRDVTAGVRDYLAWLRR